MVYFANTILYYFSSFIFFLIKWFLKKLIKEKTTIEILNTLIKEKFISTFQHAAHVAIALHKTESPLKYGVKYIQDKDLEIKKYLND